MFYDTKREVINLKYVKFFARVDKGNVDCDKPHFIKFVMDAQEYDVLSDYEKQGNDIVFEAEFKTLDDRDDAMNILIHNIGKLKEL